MLKKLILGGGMVLLLAIGGGLYLWSQATALPDWYEEQVDEPNVGRFTRSPEQPPTPRHGGLGPAPLSLVWDDSSTATGQQDLPQVVVSPKKHGAGPRRKRVKKEIRSFHLQGAVRNPTLQGAIRGSRATYDSGKLEAGVVLNLSDVSRDDFSSRDQKTLDQALQAFPSLAKQSVYVGLEDEPVFRDGIMQLGSHPRVKIGKLDYSLAAAARRLGLSNAVLRGQIDAELRRLRIADPEVLSPP